MKKVMVSIAIFWDSSFKKGLKTWMQVREDDGRFHGMWEFPGGGIEEGESPEQTLIREIDEEVGIQLDAEDKIKLFKIYRHDYPEHQVFLHTFLCETTKIPEGKGKWFQFKEEDGIKELEGNTPDANPDILRELFHKITDLQKNGFDHLVWN